MRTPDVLEMAGAALIVAGCALIAPWLALVVAGLALVLKAFEMELTRPRCGVSACNRLAAGLVRGDAVCRKHAKALR